MNSTFNDPSSKMCFCLAGLEWRPAGWREPRWCWVSCPPPGHRQPQHRWPAHNTTCGACYPLEILAPIPRSARGRFAALRLVYVSRYFMLLLQTFKHSSNQSQSRVQWCTSGPGHSNCGYGSRSCLPSFKHRFKKKKFKLTKKIFYFEKFYLRQNKIFSVRPNFEWFFVSTGTCTVVHTVQVFLQSFKVPSQIQIYGSARHR